jgi:hypothetical protein
VIFVQVPALTRFCQRTIVPLCPLKVRVPVDCAAQTFGKVPLIVPPQVVA